MKKRYNHQTENGHGSVCTATGKSCKGTFQARCYKRLHAADMRKRLGKARPSKKRRTEKDFSDMFLDRHITEKERHLLRPFVVYNALAVLEPGVAAVPAAAAKPIENKA